MLKEWLNKWLGYFIYTEYLVVAECTEQQYWDASVCKNTAHVLALKVKPGEDTLTATVSSQQAATVSSPKAATVSGLRLLVNLDCDNAISAQWLEQLPEQIITSHTNDGTGCWRWSGLDSGTSGRVAVLDTVFVKTNGYDEHFPYPSGTQDIEFSIRASLAANGKTKETVLKKPSCGFSIPNDADRKTAIGWAKVKNTPPAARDIKWHQMNNANWAYAQKLKGRTSANGGQATLDLGKRFTRLQPKSRLPKRPMPATYVTRAEAKKARAPAAATVSSAPLPAAPAAARAAPRLSPALLVSRRSCRRRPPASSLACATRYRGGEIHEHTGRGP